MPAKIDRATPHPELGGNIVWHERGRGRTVILVHGWTCDSTTWDSQVADLAQHFRVIALDLPGHGLSSHPRDGRFSLNLFASAIESVRTAAAAQRIALVGHSMGAIITGHYARRYPDRLVGMISIEGVLDPSAMPSERPGGPVVRLDGPKGMQFRREVAQGYFTPDSPTHERDRIVATMLGTDASTAEGSRRAVEEWAQCTSEVCNVPALGIFAMMEPPEIERITAVLPRYSQVRLSSRGHFPMVDEPSVLSSTVIRFLRGIQSWD